MPCLAQVFGLLDIQERLEAAKEPLTRMLAGTAAAHLLDQLAALNTALRREVHSCNACCLLTDQDFTATENTSKGL